MIKKSLMLCVALLLGVTLFSTAPIHAQEVSPVEVAIVPDSVEVVAGKTVDVAIEVRDVQDLYGMDISLSFDPELVEVADANPDVSGVQVGFGMFLDPGLVVRNRVDNDAGTLQLVMTQINPSEPKSGSGTLIVVTLRGKEAGASSPVEITSAYLAQPDGTELPTNPVSGEVRVVSSASTGPTNTPIPTQAPGTPLPTVTPKPGDVSGEFKPSPSPTNSLANPTPSQTATNGDTTASPTVTASPAATPVPPTATRAATTATVQQQTPARQAQVDPTPTSTPDSTSAAASQPEGRPSPASTSPPPTEPSRAKPSPTRPAETGADRDQAGGTGSGWSIRPLERGFVYAALGAAVAGIFLLCIPALLLLRRRRNT